VAFREYAVLCVKANAYAVDIIWGSLLHCVLKPVFAQWPINRGIASLMWLSGNYAIVCESQCVPSIVDSLLAYTALCCA
jgi:hypothetical protein